MRDDAAPPVVEELLDILLGEPETEAFLNATVSVIAGWPELGAADGCSIAVERSRRRRIAARTGPLVLRLGDAEYEHGSPGGTVLGGGPDIVVADLGGDSRWTSFALATEAGIRAVAAVALPVEGARAVLCCYSARTSAFSEDRRASIQAAAAPVAKVLGVSLLLDARAHRAANLQAALESRTVVDLAVGIIMGQNGCSQQAAIDILRSVSNTRNIKIRDVAAGVVAAVTDRVNTHFDE